MGIWNPSGLNTRSFLFSALVWKASAEIADRRLAVFSGSFPHYSDAGV